MLFTDLVAYIFAMAGLGAYVFAITGLVAYVFAVTGLHSFAVVFFGSCQRSVKNETLLTILYAALLPHYIYRTIMSHLKIKFIQKSKSILLV